MSNLFTDERFGVLVTDHDFVLVRPASDTEFKLGHRDWHKYVVLGRDRCNELVWEEWPDAMPWTGNRMYVLDASGCRRVVAVCGVDTRKA